VIVDFRLRESETDITSLGIVEAQRSRPSVLENVAKEYLRQGYGLFSSDLNSISPQDCGNLEGRNVVILMPRRNASIDKSLEASMAASERRPLKRRREEKDVA
jgi:hypothetical protein